MHGGLSLWAIVPVKPLVAAKSRLSPALSQSERAALVLAMLRRTLRVLKRVDALSGILVVSDDARVRSVVEAIGRVCYLRERGTGGLNAALSQSSRRVAALGAHGLLVIPGDLPLLSPGSVRLMLGDVTLPTVVIAPDRAERGTNALFVAPLGLIPFAFGEGSFQAHTTAVRAQGIEPRIVRDSRLAIDLDRPDDLRSIQGLVASIGIR